MRLNRLRPLDPLFDPEIRRGSSNTAGSPGVPYTPVQTSWAAGGGASDAVVDISGFNIGSFMVGITLSTDPSTVVGGGWLNPYHFTSFSSWDVQVWTRVKQSGDNSVTFDKAGINNNNVAVVMAFAAPVSSTVTAAGYTGNGTGTITMPDAPGGGRNYFVALCYGATAPLANQFTFPGGFNRVAYVDLGAGSDFKIQVDDRTDNGVGGGSVSRGSIEIMAFSMTIAA